MPAFKFNQEAKQVFIDCYQNPEISSLELPKAITKALQEKGFLDQDQKITSKLCRVALEDKLGLKYVNRPRVKHEALIDFEDDVEEQLISSNQEETLEEEEFVEEEETEPVNDWNTRQEPSKFEF